MLRGGRFTPAAAGLLLHGLAAACPHLEELVLLPEALCGLGDAEMPLLAELPRLKVRPAPRSAAATDACAARQGMPGRRPSCTPLSSRHANTLSYAPCPLAAQRLEFQAYRLTGAGLLRLAALPDLESLSVQGIDCLAGLESHCFRLCPSLKQLSLSGDYTPPPGARPQTALAGTARWIRGHQHGHPLARRLPAPLRLPRDRQHARLPPLPAPRPPDVLQRLRDVEGLTMSFRSTDKVNALLRTLTAHVTASLVQLDLVRRERARAPHCGQLHAWHNWRAFRAASARPRHPPPPARRPRPTPAPLIQPRGSCES